MEMTFCRAALLAATIFFVGCDDAPKPADTASPAATVLEGKTMGTFWRVSVVDVDAVLRNYVTEFRRSLMPTISCCPRTKMTRR